MTIHISNRLAIAFGVLLIAALTFFGLAWTPNDAAAKNKVTNLSGPLEQANYQAQYLSDYWTNHRNGVKENTLDADYYAKLTKEAVELETALNDSPAVLAEMQKLEGSNISYRAKRSIGSSVADYRIRITDVKKFRISTLALVLGVHVAILKKPASTVAGYEAELADYRVQKAYLDKYKEAGGGACPNLTDYISATLAFDQDVLDFKNGSTQGNGAKLASLLADMDKQNAILKRVSGNLFSLDTSQPK